MKIMYKCNCMKADRIVEVRDREPDEEIVHWVENAVATAIWKNHKDWSPHCRKTTTEYVKIPLDESADGIGMKPPGKH